MNELTGLQPGEPRSRVSIPGTDRSAYCTGINVA